MPNDFASAYSGTSGLRDEFTAKVTSAEFTYDSEYNNGNTLICRIECVDEDGTEEVFKLSTGSGWEDDEKGTKAKREDGGEPKGFNKSCNYQRFVAGAAETTFSEVLFSAGPPWDASIWAGEPTFRFERKEYPAFTKGDPPKELVVPVEYLGSGDAEKPKKATRTAKAAKAEPEAEAELTPAEKAKAKAAAAKAAKAAPAADEGDNADMALLKTIAAESETHDEFMERAYGELEDADALEDTIADEDWYASNHG